MLAPILAKTLSSRVPRRHSAIMATMLALGSACDDGSDATTETTHPGDHGSEGTSGGATTTTGPGGSSSEGGSTSAASTTGSTDESTGGGDCTLTTPTEVGELVALYASAWNETDADRRTCILEAAWADAATYSDPMTPTVTGRDGLATTIANFQAAVPPGTQIVLASNIDSYRLDGQLAVLRFDWRIQTGEGAVISAGFDFGEISETGQLQRIVGFFGPMPELGNDAEGTQAVARYGAAWLAETPAERSPLIAEGFGRMGWYMDPDGQGRGHDYLEQRIAGFQSALPGAKIIISSGVDRYDNWGRFDWQLIDPAGALITDGMDVVEFAADGRLNRVTGFFGRLMPVR